MRHRFLYLANSLLTTFSTLTLSLPLSVLFGTRYFFFFFFFIYSSKMGSFYSNQCHSLFLQAGTWEEKNLNKWASDRIKVCPIKLALIEFRFAETKWESNCFFFFNGFLRSIVWVPLSCLSIFVCENFNLFAGVTCIGGVLGVTCWQS